MEPECLRTVVVTPHFLGSVCELPDQQRRAVLEALRLFMANPRAVSLHSEPFGATCDGIHSLRAGDTRILLSRAPNVKLLFVGSDEAAGRFLAERMQADATAFAEVPVAFQLHMDFWQNGPAEKFESPSCGAPVSPDDLAGLILHGRRYLPLAHLLLSRGPEVASVELGFREIETALGEDLPHAAHTNPAWWADDRSNAQSNAWLAIGWQATVPDLQKGTITFIRNPRQI